MFMLHLYLPKLMQLSVQYDSSVWKTFLMQPTNCYSNVHTSRKDNTTKSFLSTVEEKEQLRHTVAKGHLPGRDCSMVARIWHVVLKRADQLLPLSDDKPQLSQVGSASKLDVLPDLWAQLQLFLQFAHTNSHTSQHKPPQSATGVDGHTSMIDQLITGTLGTTQHELQLTTMELSVAVDCETLTTLTAKASI